MADERFFEATECLKVLVRTWATSGAQVPREGQEQCWNAFSRYCYLVAGEPDLHKQPKKTCHDAPLEGHQVVGQPQGLRQLDGRVAEQIIENGMPLVQPGYSGVVGLTFYAETTPL